jgi:hypothetical protein
MSAGRPSPNSASAANYEPPSQPRLSLKSAAGCGFIPEQKSPCPSPDKGKKSKKKAKKLANSELAAGEDHSERKSHSPDPKSSPKEEKLYVFETQPGLIRENSLPEGIECKTPDSPDLPPDRGETPRSKEEHTRQGEYCRVSCSHCRQGRRVPGWVLRQAYLEIQSIGQLSFDVATECYRYFQRVFVDYKDQPGQYINQDDLELLVGLLLSPHKKWEEYEVHPEFKEIAIRSNAVYHKKLDRQLEELVRERCKKMDQQIEACKSAKKP